MTTSSSTGLFNSRRGRIILENLTAYAFLLPAGLVIFVFHLFPVVFAFFVSLHRWRRFPDEYQGLDNYAKALGDFAYVAFTWLSIAAVVYALLLLYRLWKSSRQQGEPKARWYLLPGALAAFAVFMFTRYFFLLLPVVLDVPRRLRGLEVTRELFIGEFFKSFNHPDFPLVPQAGNEMLLTVILALVVGLLFWRFVRVKRLGYYWARSTMVFLLVGGAFLLLQLTIDEMRIAVEERQIEIAEDLEKAREDLTEAEAALQAAETALADVPADELTALVAQVRAGDESVEELEIYPLLDDLVDAQDDLADAQDDLAEAERLEAQPPIWALVVLISLGAFLVIAAYVVWRWAPRGGDLRLVIMGITALLLLTGGYILVAELPLVIGNADDDLWQGFRNTVFFAFSTVPIQLSVGMVLAYMLFQNIKGRALFRLIYFMPYVMPFVATSAVFRLLFSHRPESPVNQVIAIFGIEPQRWLLEPAGVTQLLFGPGVIEAIRQSSPVLADWVAGPSLALMSIVFYSAWTYIGYSAVIFLAGLGNIPGELYEAARIDGASRWAEFRHITFPLLSPTTFFLSMIAIIGTFKAFVQIFIMRSPAASSAVDTASIYIFEMLRTQTRYGYGSAMAFVLFAVILTLTIIQNRYMGRKVFYG